MREINPKRKPQAAPPVKPAKIDWQEIHRRVEAAQASVPGGLDPSPEKKKEILRARAAMLAREPAKAETEEAIEVAQFLLAQERYGIETRWIREVVPLRELAPLPAAPPFVLGIFNVRGKILPVMDIKKLFDLPEKGLTDLNKVLVIQGGALELGILADQILDMRSIPLRMIQPSLPTLTGIREEYLKGVTAERLVILDAEKILTDPRLAAGASAEK
jgi:purine-binding chemotaxis protein CheW